MGDHGGMVSSCDMRCDQREEVNTVTDYEKVIRELDLCLDGLCNECSHKDKA